MHGHLHIAGERRHDVDVEAGHLVQTVEHHRVLPREDGDRDRTMTEGGVDSMYFAVTILK